MTMFGYMGTLLRVNLSQKQITKEKLEPTVAKNYIGGAGLATRIIYDEVAPNIDPLGEQNKLIFMTGPLTGTAFPTTARYEVCTKSPLTNCWLDASSSGQWGAAFKRTGFDGVIIEGTSSKPVYLFITDDHAELKDAAHLWGQDAFGVQEAIRDELGDRRIKVTCIGPAGEKKVLLAGIINDEGRAAGRGGAGAVMGSKNLKAIAVRGTKRPQLAHNERFRKIVKELVAEIRAGSVAFGKYGTAIILDNEWASGDIPVKNWQVGLWKEGCLKIGGQRMAETILKPHPPCLGCPIQCSRWIEIKDGHYKMEGPGPEYETLAAFGTMVLNDHLDSICYANDLCNRYGLDTISTGSSIAFAIEAYEKGILNREDTGGLELTWGDHETIIKVVKLIGERKGLGELLGQGVRKAAEKLGQGSEKFAVHVKGLEVPMHDPRAFFSMAVNYATSPRGACHLHGNPNLFERGSFKVPEAGLTHKQGRFDKEGKGLAAKVAQDVASIYNSMVMCCFVLPYMNLHMIAEVLNLVTGFDYDRVELLKAGERISNLQRLFNIHCGMQRADDILPPRLLEPVQEGGAAGKVPDLEYQLKEYYQARGWNADGKPTKEKLVELELEE